MRGREQKEVTQALEAPEAWEALRIADADPGLASELATAALRRARARRDHATMSVARRALGVAALHRKDGDAAVQHFRAAAAAGRRHGDQPLVVEARIQLAMALNYRGRARYALREIDGVLQLELDALAHARATAQRGVLLSQLGRYDDGLAAFQQAMPALRRAGDSWLWRMLANRGLVHAYRHEFAAAEADLAEAETMCRRRGLDLSVGFVQQNQGWVAGLRGDLPAALAHLDRAQRCFHRLGSDLGEVLTDRSQLLLGANLAGEARHAAEQAVALFERTGQELTLPEVRLLLARAAIVEGEPVRAREQAILAVREFAAQQRTAWATLGRLVVAQARAAEGELTADDLDELGALADDLDSARWAVAALEARVMAGRLALSVGEHAAATHHLATATRGRTRGPVLLRARAWYAEALLRQARGNRRGARIALRCGLRVVDEHRATFGATDLRAHASGHRVELAELGLAMALEDGVATRVLRWAEQGRASHLLLRPVRPPEDPELARALGELRAVVAQADVAAGGQQPGGRLAARRLELEREIRDSTRRLPADPQGGRPALVEARALADRLGPAALVELVVSGGVLHAVTVVAGRTTLHRLGDLAPLLELLDQLPFALRRLGRAAASDASRAAAHQLLRRAAAQLDSALLAPLRAVLGDRQLVVVPTGRLQSLPWSVLPSCRGRPVTVAPSAALWYAAQEGTTVRPGVAVAAGPGLTGAHAEAVGVAAHHGAQALTGDAATVAATTRLLDGVGLAHLAAHGDVHPGNPLFSAIRLADGPLTVYDLDQLVATPELVVLSACNVGRSAVTAGDELLGLAAAFLAHGTRQVVASVMPVPDAETTAIMVRFHELLRSGNSVAAALADAQCGVDQADPAAVAAAAGFVGLGADGLLAVSGPARAPERLLAAEGSPAAG